MGHSKGHSECNLFPHKKKNLEKGDIFYSILNPDLFTSMISGVLKFEMYISANLVLILLYLLL